MLTDRYIPSACILTDLYISNVCMLTDLYISNACMLTDRYIAQEEYLESFMMKMKPLYTPQLDDMEGDKEKDLAVFFNRLLHSFIFWNASQYSAPALASDCSLILANYRYIPLSFGSSLLSFSLCIPTPKLQSLENSI